MIALLFTERRRRVPARCAVCGERPELELRDGMLVCEKCVVESDKELAGRVVLRSDGPMVRGELLAIAARCPPVFAPTRLVVDAECALSFMMTAISCDGCAVRVEAQHVGDAPARFRAALVEARDW